MIKRNRDIALSHLAEKERPISVVLTTLAARFYTGAHSPTVALLQVLEAIINAIDDESAERLIVLNPTNENEDLSERWENQPELYQTFVDWVHGFRQDLQDLTEVRGLHNIEAKLKEMFGESLTKDVMIEFAEQINIKRQNGSLAVAKGTGLIVPAIVVHSTTVKPNTFHGRE